MLRSAPAPEKLLVPTKTPFASNPNVGKSANRLFVVVYARSLNPCVGSAVFDLANRILLFVVWSVVIIVTNQRWLAGSYKTRGSLNPPGFEPRAAVQNALGVMLLSSDPSLLKKAKPSFCVTTKLFGPAA